MLGTGSADFTHEIGDTPDGADYFGHGGSGLVCLGRALLHPLHAGTNELLDFLGRLGRATGKAAHLSGHHSKPPALFTGTRGFDSSIERQDIGLESNAVDHTNDVGDLARTLVDAFHGVHNLRNHDTPFDRHLAGTGSQLVGLAGVVCVLLHRRVELLHGSRCLLQGTGLAFGARRQVMVALRNLDACGRHSLGTLAHLADHAREPFLHFYQCLVQACDLIGALHLHHRREVTSRHRMREPHRILDRAGNAAHKSQSQHRSAQHP